jgi:hypothetical protein
MKQTLSAVVALLIVTAAAATLYLHAYQPGMFRARQLELCEQRGDAMRALASCIESSSCLITLSDVERLARLQRQCPTSQNAQ